MSNIRFDTILYVIRGGRRNKAHGLLGTVLRVGPLLTMRDGDLLPAGVARTKAKAVERLYDLREASPN